MKEIKFLLIGDQGVDITTLVDTYLWKLHFGYAYHDHLIQHRRYHITLQEITSSEDVQQILSKNNCEIIYICLICFNATPKKSLTIWQNKWLRESLNLMMANVNVNIFMVALQCDLTRNRLLTKLWPPNNVRLNEVSNICRYYGDKIVYLKCLNCEAQNVRTLFNTAINMVLYNNNNNRSMVSRRNKLLNKGKLIKHLHLISCSGSKYQKIKCSC